MIQIVSAEFIKSAVTPEQYPKAGLAEFAFFGRSNAGKSSLINMLVNRKALVKTGARPGMTRFVNFFKINNSFMIADLPGYGYAQRSAEENRVFDRMLADYATTRESLKTLFFLIDLRREPGPVEKESIQFFEKLNIEVVVVGTKADKLSKNMIRTTVRSWSSFFNRAEDMIPVTSATKKNGRDVLLSLISERLNSVL